MMTNYFILYFFVSTRQFSFSFCTCCIDNCAFWSFSFRNLYIISYIISINLVVTYLEFKLIWKLKKNGGNSFYFLNVFFLKSFMSIVN